MNKKTEGDRALGILKFGKFNDEDVIRIITYKRTQYSKNKRFDVQAIPTEDSMLAFFPAFDVICKYWYLLEYAYTDAGKIVYSVKFGDNHDYNISGSIKPERIDEILEKLENETN